MTRRGRTVNLPLDVVTAELDLRPVFVLHDGEHPLIAEQRDGITLDRVLDLVRPRLHEIAPQLACLAR